MQRSSLRIPLALAWTALAGGGVAVASSCSPGPSGDTTATYCVGVIDGSLEIVDADASKGCPDGDIPQEVVT